MVVVISAIAAFFLIKSRSKTTSSEIIKEIKPASGSIESIISTTGTVLPKNRLEIKPPVNGRVDSILVQEGENVKIGQVLSWMSSTERATLLDAAAGQGEEAIKYWKEVYKPIALISPIDGQVIVATTQPGQTVTTAEAVVVLSDKLIVRAQVDETDIGRVKLGQNASVFLDAYPDKKIKAVVDHIYYESETVNNVTIYNVDLLPQEIPPFFRSGMNATVNFVVESKENILVIPQDAVRRNKEGAFVLVKNNNKQPTLVAVTLGVSDDKNIEVISGVTANDTIVITTKKYVIPANASGGTNPFAPFGRRR